MAEHHLCRCGLAFTVCLGWNTRRIVDAPWCTGCSMLATVRQRDSASRFARGRVTQVTAVSSVTCNALAFLRLHARGRFATRADGDPQPEQRAVNREMWAVDWRVGAFPVWHSALVNCGCEARQASARPTETNGEPSRIGQYAPQRPISLPRDATSRTTPHVTCVTRHAQNAKPTSRCRTVAP